MADTCTDVSSPEINDKLMAISIQCDFKNDVCIFNVCCPIVMWFSNWLGNILTLLESRPYFSLSIAILVWKNTSFMLLKNYWGKHLFSILSILVNPGTHLILTDRLFRHSLAKTILHNKSLSRVQEHAALLYSQWLWWPPDPHSHCECGQCKMVNAYGQCSMVTHAMEA